MALPLLPGLQKRHLSTTGGLWSDLRGTSEESEEKITLHEPTDQELLQLELMMLRLDPGYEPVHPKRWQYREFVLPIVKRDPRLLWLASNELQDDKEVVMAAVTRDGGALAYASARLQDDKEVVIAAVTKDGNLLKYASERLRDDNEVVWTAVMRGDGGLQYASARLKNAIGNNTDKRSMHQTFRKLSLNE